MSSLSIARNVGKSTKFQKKSATVKNLTSFRAATVVSQPEKCESPELAAAKPFEEIPGPFSLPFIGSSWVYFPVIGRWNVQRQHKAVEEMHRMYGDIVRESSGSLKLVSSFSPESQEVMAIHEGKYPFRGEISTLKAYRESRKQWYKSTGVLILKGHEWLDLRKKTQKHLMKPRTIQAYLEPIQDVARDLVKRIYEKRNQNKEVDGFLEDLYNWALESVAYVGLDTRLGCLSRNLSPDSDGLKLIESIQTQLQCMSKLEPLFGNFPFWKYLPSPTWRKYAKACDIFTEITYKYINRSLENLKRDAGDDLEMTMLQSMLIHKELDKAEIMVMVADMLLAGVDTTSHAVAFLLYQLSRNPEKREILAQEIRNLLPNTEDRISHEVIQKLHYLKACMKESMRLFPIIRGTARILDHDVALNGYRVPAGTVIFCVFQQIFKMEKYFKNVTQFLPERWLNKEEKLSNPFAYVPFGFGSRSCIGRRLAELQIICVMTEIIRNFDVQYHHEDIDMVTRLGNVPDKPLNFSFNDYQ